jgi:hypothetical protein
MMASFVMVMIHVIMAVVPCIRAILVRGFHRAMRRLINVYVVVMLIVMIVILAHRMDVGVFLETVMYVAISRLLVLLAMMASFVMVMIHAVVEIVLFTRVIPVNYRDCYVMKQIVDV